MHSIGIRDATFSVQVWEFPIGIWIYINKFEVQTFHVNLLQSISISSRLHKSAFNWNYFDDRIPCANISHISNWVRNFPLNSELLIRNVNIFIKFNDCSSGNAKYID